MKLVHCANGNVVNAATAATGAFSGGVTAGNLIVVALLTFNSGTTTVAVTDSLGNTYAQAGSYTTNGSHRTSIWYAKNITGGANTVTVTPSASSFTVFSALELSVADISTPLDGSGGNSGTGTALDAGSIAVSNAGSIVVAIFSMVSSEADYTPTGPFAMTFSITNSSQIRSAAAWALADNAITPGLTCNASGTWCASAASFKAAAGGGGGASAPPNVGMRFGGRL